MNFLLRKIQNITHNGVKVIIELERKEKIRDDFIEFYRVCVIPDEGPLHSSYFSQNVRFYFERLLYWRLRAKNLKISKSKKRIEEIVDTGESISDLFTIFDLFLTIGAFLFPSLLFFSIIENWHPLLSLLFLGFAVPIILLKIFVKSLVFFGEEIRYLNENFVISQNDVNFGSRYYGKKDSIIAAYIWNRSLCNSSIISSIIFLLLIKTISKTFYKKIYDSMIGHLPLYMPEYVKDKSRIKFLRFLISRQQKSNN